jgi:hypothetical protein
MEGRDTQMPADQQAMQQGSGSSATAGGWGRGSVTGGPVRVEATAQAEQQARARQQADQQPMQEQAMQQ